MDPEYARVVLSSRAVLGEYQLHKLIDGKRMPVGEPIPDYYPAIVTPSEWLAARESIKAKTRFVCKDGKAGFRGGRDKANSVFPLVYDADNGVPMVYHRKPGEPAYLVSKWQQKVKAHRLRYDRFEEAFLGFFEDLDWQAIAGEGESEEVKKAQSQLDAVLGDLDRCSKKIERLQALVDEGSFSRSLFENLDLEKARMGDLSARQEKLAAEVAMARSKAAALHEPEHLIAAIRCGSDPELRLRLKAEIKKRIAHIEVAFEQEEIDPRDRLDYFAYIRFINGARRAIGLKDGHALLLKIEGDLEMLRKLEEEYDEARIACSAA
jgi:hypothetical protein